MTVLVLGGTAEAHAVATELHGHGRDVVTSLAGRVPAPRLPPGRIRVGGFGGPSGLARWLSENAVAAVVDATHPFAAQISLHAAEACAASDVELLRLERPPWRPQPGDRWRAVPDLVAAAAAVEHHQRVFLALGRQDLARFATGDAWFLIRAITPPDPPLPRRHEIVLARGPFGVEDEVALLRENAIDVIVTRNSGGEMSAAKLEAARRRGLEVVMVKRPCPVPGLRTVATVAEVVAWIRDRHRATPMRRAAPP